MTATILSPATLTAFPFFGAVTPFDDVLPNPRRTITPECDGYAGANFDGLSIYETDTFTFDFIDRLTTMGLPVTEAIVSVDKFDLVPVDGSDAGVAARTLGIATISGTQVSQRFGNWQVGSVRYRVFARVITTKSNTISNWSYFWAAPPGFRQ